MKDLGTLGGPLSGGTAINSKDQVVGYAAVDPVTLHAFLYTAAAGMKDLGTLGVLTNSEAYAINSAGLVVGTSETDIGPSRGFLYDGSMHDLGSLGGSDIFP